MFWKGDIILSVNGRDVSFWDEAATAIHHSQEEQIELGLQRSDKQFVVNVNAQKKQLPTASGEKVEVFLVGISPKIIETKVSLFRAIELGFIGSKNITVMICQGLWGMISGKISADEIGGPILILEVAGEQAAKGMEYLLSYGALLSVNLAILNLLPIPILDGGHLLFFLIEGLFGSISMRKKEIAQNVGLFALLSLMIFAVFNDVTRDRTNLTGEIEWEDMQVQEAPSETQEEEGVGAADAMGI